MAVMDCYNYNFMIFMVIPGHNKIISIIIMIDKPEKMSVSMQCCNDSVNMSISS